MIGGGPMGLAVANELTILGHNPMWIEANDRLGDMAACFDFTGMYLERYCHHHYLSDMAFSSVDRDASGF